MAFVAYFAKLGNTGVYFFNREQIDKYLMKGANIYRDDGNQKITLIATPEEGYLEGSPASAETFELPITEKRRKNG